MTSPSQAILNLSSLKTETEVEVWEYPDGYALFVKNKRSKEKKDARSSKD